MSALTAPTELATCSYRRAIDGLKAIPKFDADDAETVASWEAGETSAAQIATMLRHLGFKTSATSIKDHRRGECICAVNV